MDSQLQEARELAGEKDKFENQEGHIVPDIRPFEKCACLYIDENIELENLGMSVGKLYEKASREGINTTGNHFVIYDGISDEDFSMKTCLPVEGYTGSDSIEVFEKKCIHLHFNGGFSKVSQAHRIIKDFADYKKLQVSGRIFEVYNKDMSVDVYYVV